MDELRQQFEEVVAHTGQRVSDLSAAWLALDVAPQVISEHWRAQITPERQVRSLTFVVIFLFLGAGLEWLVRQYTNPVRRRIEFRRYDTPMAQIGGAFTRALLAFSGLVAFAVGSVGTFSAFAWPPLLYALALNALITIVAVRAVGALLVLFLAPFVPRLRLLPLSTPMARMVGRVTLVFSAVLIAALSLLDVFGRVMSEDGGRTQTPETLAMALVLAAAVLLVALGSIIYGFHVARQQGVGAPGTLRRWRAILCALCVLVFVCWLFDLRALMWSLLVIGPTIPVLKLLRLWVDSGFDKAFDDYAAKLEAEPQPEPEHPDDPPPEPEPVVDPYETYRPIAHRLVRFAIIISAVFVLSLIWNLGIFENTQTPTVIQKLFSVLIDSAAALLIADLVWTWARTAIDRRLNAYQPPEDGSAPGPEARMATLLPLLRVVLLVMLMTMVLMSILSSLGVNIAPILAGASVMGIAIGFGAQSLVKDVVSGIFFLIDDAFRVGEYVEIGELRGTVEKISIRSLQIRHHRGAVHTLPFGELKSMTNYSRDWVIMKLEFRVPFDTDLALVKKLVKKVGAELKASEVYGDSIIETLKSQGVRRMEEFNMVVGVKFMTKPGEQWLVRRDAYQKVRDIFEQNGIRMAERNVKVELSGDEKLTEDERKAVTAAAEESLNIGPAEPAR